MKQFAAYLVMMLAYLLLPSLVTAETNLPDEQQPVNIQADRLLASEKQGNSVYRGNVVVTQGSLTLKGDKIDVFHPQGQVNQVITIGNPATFKRFNPTEQAWVYGKAERIEYHTTKKTVLLIGNAEVEQPGNHLIKGPKLFYDMQKQTLQAESTPQEQKRVSVTFTPATQDETKSQGTAE